MKAARREIAFVTDYDARDVTAFSGVGHYIARTLQEHVGDIHHVDVSIEPGLFERRRPYWQLAAGSVQRMGRLAATLVNARQFDLVFCPGSLPVAGLDTEIPIVLWKDAAFGSLSDTYFTDLDTRIRANGERMERAAMQRASLVLFASDWGAEAATETYGLDADRIRVVPWGANLDVDPGLETADRSASNPLELLFVGRPWERKNGPLALGVVEELRSRGVAARLTVVGSDAADARTAGAEVHPFLDKRDPAQRSRLDALYRRADFLLFPSRHEAYGVVLCEAAAYGVPALAACVEGIPTIVADGKSGVLLAADAGAGDYADAIARALGHGYRLLRMGARTRYETLLNWDTAGTAVEKALMEAGL